MIKVSVWRDETGNIRRFRAEGHSGYAEYGSDIICSAVSALVQTAVLGLTQVAGLEVDVDVDQAKGLLDCRILPHSSRVGESEQLRAVKQSAILETMVIGLSQIASDYQEFVRIVDRK